MLCLMQHIFHHICLMQSDQSDKYMRNGITVPINAKLTAFPLMHFSIRFMLFSKSFIRSMPSILPCALTYNVYHMPNLLEPRVMNSFRVCKPIIWASILSSISRDMDQIRPNLSEHVPFRFIKDVHRYDTQYIT